MQRRAERPDWHMRRPFLVAFLLTAATASLFDWRAGPLLIAMLALRYAFAKATFGLWP
jgi:hypothetical protein